MNFSMLSRASFRGILSVSKAKRTWVKNYSFPYEPVATVAQYIPYTVKVERGATYDWCSCGGSQTQPWTDGACQCSKKEGGFRPITYTSQHTGYKLLCGCKHCSYKPEFDGGCYLKFVEDFPINGAALTFAVWFTFATLTSYYWHP